MGRFKAWGSVPATSVNLAIGHAVAGNLPEIHQPVNISQPLAYWLSPADNIIQNGDFENELSDTWQVSGSITPTRQVSSSLSGFNGIQFGQVPQTLFGEPQEAAALNRTDGMRECFAVDDYGINHVFYSDWVGETHTLMYVHNRNGTWSTPIAVQTIAQTLGECRATTDSRQRVHVFTYNHYFDNLDNGAYFTLAHQLILTDGTFFPPITLLQESPSLILYDGVAVAPDDSVYIAASSKLLRVLPDGMSFTRVSLPGTILATYNGVLTRSPAGHIIFISKDSSLGIQAWTYNANHWHISGALQDFQFQSYGFDRDNNLYIFATVNEYQNKAAYLARLLNDEWVLQKLPQLMPEQYDTHVLNAWVDEEKRTNVLWTVDTNRPALYWDVEIQPGLWNSQVLHQFAENGYSVHTYTTQFADGRMVLCAFANFQSQILIQDHAHNWISEPVPGYCSTDFVARNSQIYILNPRFESGKIYVVGPHWVNHSDTGFVQQTVFVSPTLHSPWLGFAYQLSGQNTTAWGGGLTLTITSSQSSQTFELPPVPPETDWGHFSLDVSRWVSQTITLTVKLEQAANQPRIYASIDDVALGSTYSDVWVQLVPEHSSTTDNLRLRLLIGNRGAAAAQPGSVQLTLPDEFSFVSASVVPSAPLTWGFDELPAHSQQVIEIEVRAKTNATLGEMVAFSAQWQSDGIDLTDLNHLHTAEIWFGYRTFLPLTTR